MFHCWFVFSLAILIFDLFHMNVCWFFPYLLLTKYLYYLLLFLYLFVVAFVVVLVVDFGAARMRSLYLRTVRRLLFVISVVAEQKLIN